MAKKEKNYIICKDGVSEYKIVLPKNATRPILLLAEKLQKGFEPYSEKLPEIVKDGEVDTALEILFYKTERAESKQLLAELGYTDYAIGMRGGKIAIVSHSEAGMIEAVERFIFYLDSFRPAALIGKPCVAMPDGFTINGFVVRFAGEIPRYEGGVLAGVNDAESSSYTVSIDETSEPEYRAYLAKLEENGYKKYTENEIEGNLFAIYTGEEKNIFCQYAPRYSKAKITAAHKGDLPELESENIWKNKGVKPFFAMLEMVSAVDTCGFGFVWRLSDGSFIVLDGGIPEYDERDGLAQHDQLFNFLKKHSPTDEIRVAAWLFSHSHNDHIGAFMSFAMKYSPYVKVERVIYNLPADTVIGEGHVGYQNRFRKCCRMFGRDTKVIHAHTGEKFFIRDAEIEMLYTLDDFYPNILMQAGMGKQPLPYLKHHTYPKNRFEFNDTSFVFSVKMAGQKMMMLGDATFLCCDMLVDRYGHGLKSEIVQLAHHGSNGGTLQVYQYIEPEVIMFPVATVRFMERIKNSLNSYMIDRMFVPEMYLSGTGDTVLKLPHKISKKYM